MNKPYFHNDHSITINLNDLRTAWRMLATPEKQKYVNQTLETVWTLREAGPEKAIFTLVAASAWLTDENWTDSESD